MDTKFMNSKESKTFNPYWFLPDFTEKNRLTKR